MSKTGKTLYPSRIQTPLPQLKPEAMQALLTRHPRIKEEIRRNLIVIIGVGGASITTSLTLFDKIAPHRHLSWILAISWAFISMSILISVVTLVVTTTMSITHQDTLEKLYKDEKIKLFYYGWPATPGGHHFEVFHERFPGELGMRLAIWASVIGVIFILLFSTLNVLGF